MISNSRLRLVEIPAPTAQSIADAKAVCAAERKETGLSIEEETGKLLGLALVRLVAPKEH